MDQSEIWLILKVFFFSLGLSILVKYGGSGLSFAPSNFNAILAISLPSMVIFLMLLRRWYFHKLPCKTGTS